MLKKIGWGILTIILLVGAFLFWYLDKDTKDKYESVDFDQSMIPQFNEIEVPFANQYSSKTSLPLVGSAMIDIDQDGIEELFVGGGRGQKDGIFSYEYGTFANVTNAVSWTKNLEETTYGTAVLDMNGDAVPDLLIARDEAVYYYENNNGAFEKPVNLNLKFNAKSQPVSITAADLNRDGHPDLFVSAYLKKHLMEGQTIFNKEGYGATSELFINLGDNTFQSITKEAGLDYVHNTFTAVFVDLDNDGFEDLVVAHDTGEPRIYRNNGNLFFTMIKHPLTGVFSYPMGIAVGDYDNNGFQDLFFSNVGSSLPEALVRGDLRKEQTLVTEWILLANDGKWNFVDRAKDTKVAAYEFSWGAVFEDFNLDGLQDLVVSENYVDLPNSKIRPLPSRFLMQLPDHTFTNVEDNNQTQNPCNGITPLIADLNNDGAPDLVHVNLNGAVKAFISEANTGNNYLNIRLPETVEYLNAHVTLTLDNGIKIKKQKIIGEGLSSDQAHTLFFGLGKERTVKSLTIIRMDGKTQNYPVGTINSTIKVEVF